MRAFALAAALCCAAGAAHAAACTTPYTFVNGQIADATEVNANFSAILNCINTQGAITNTNPTVSSFNTLYFTTMPNQFAAMAVVTTLSGSVSDSAGSFRDSFYASVQDSDTTVYTNSHYDYGGRFASFGAYSGGDYVLDYKDHIGLSAYALGNTPSAPLVGGFAPGIEGLSGEAWQYGEGIVDNEIAVHNPAPANGGTGHSISMAALQAIVDNSYADASRSTVLDYSHTAYGLLVTSSGTHNLSAGIGFNDFGLGGNYWTLIDGSRAKTLDSGIIMPGTAPGGVTFAGTIIDYGTANGAPAGGSYTYWNGSVAGGQYAWVDSGQFVMKVDGTAGAEILKSLYVDALPQVAAGTGKHFVCIDPTTHEFSEGTGASCN